jgi:hypothetical protein
MVNRKISTPRDMIVAFTRVPFLASCMPTQPFLKPLADIAEKGSPSHRVAAEKNGQTTYSLKA